MSPFCRICGLSLRGEKECQPSPRLCFDDEAFASPSTRQPSYRARTELSAYGADSDQFASDESNRTVSEHLRQIRQSGYETEIKWSVPNLRSGSGGDSRPAHKVLT